MCLVFRCSRFNVASLTFKKKIKNNHQNSLKQALPHNSFHSFPTSVYTRCWMWRLLRWYSTCPCCEMIHLQVCLPASQASTHSFSPPLPRWAKAPHLLRLQRRRLFSHMTSLPRGVCLSLWIPTKHALMASLCLTWVNYIQLEKVLRLRGTSHETK